MESLLKTSKKATKKNSKWGAARSSLCNVSLYKYQLLYNSVDILQTDTKAKFNLSFCYLIQQEFSTYDSCKTDF